MICKGSISSTDVLCFGSRIVFRKCDEGWLAISVDTANWIVLFSDFQRLLLERLISGKSVGEMKDLLDSESKILELKRLLASIFARDFAEVGSAPVLVRLESSRMLNCYLTNACNLRCKHCFMRSGNKLTGELTTAQWQTVLSDFRSAGGESVTFTGGEPLMNKGFEEIVRFAHSLGLKVTVLTNGLLWTDRMIQNLAPYISEVQISIDGVDEESNAAIRGKGHFDRVVKTVIAFANSGCRTSVATTFTFDNISDGTKDLYKRMVDEIKSRCSNPVFFKLSKKILSGRETEYSESENRLFFEKISEIERYVDPNAQFSNFMEGHTPNLVADNCGFGGLSIGADGEAYFCNRISEVQSYGNVKTVPVGDLLKIGYQIHCDTGVDNVVPCKDCYLRYICGGGCRIDDFNFNGKLKGFEADLAQTACSEDSKLRLERKMIDSFIYKYNF